MSDAATREVERRMERIEALIQEVEAGADPAGRAAARELVRTLLELHSEGLARVIEALERAGAPGRAIAAACAGDAIVRGMLALHELELEVETGDARREQGQLVQIRVPRASGPGIADGAGRGG